MMDTKSVCDVIQQDDVCGRLLLYVLSYCNIETEYVCSVLKNNNNNNNNKNNNNNQ